MPADSHPSMPQHHRGDERLRYLQCDAKEVPLSPLVNIVRITAFIRCARGVEAAGNSGRSSETNALQVRQTAQDFWQAVRPLVASIDRRRLSDRQKPVSRPKVRRELPALAAKLRAFSVSFFKQSDEPPASRKPLRRQGKASP